MTTDAPRKHKAKYSPQIVELFQSIVDEWQGLRPSRPRDTDRRGRGIPYVLDPFAGVGRIHRLDQAATFAVELEHEWGDQSAELGPTIIGNYLTTPLTVFEAAFGRTQFDLVMTSPTYGNRMADHHNARDDSERNTYKHTLGRDLTPGNSGAMQWGPEYRAFHRRAWWRVVNEHLTDDGWFVLNIKDHIRDFEVQYVSTWHRITICNLGMSVRAEYTISAKGLKYGENHDSRVPHEMVYVFERNPKNMRDIARYDADDAVLFPPDEYPGVHASELAERDRQARANLPTSQ